MKNRNLYWIVFATLALTVGLFWTCLRNGFAYDDQAMLLENWMLRTDNVWDIFTGRAAYDYVPLTFLSYWLEYRVVGLEPFLYHLTNLVLHLFNIVLVFIYLRRLFPEYLWAVVIAGVAFAIHPLHVESVAWVAERKDVLSTLFFLLALLCFGESWKGKFASVGFYALACFSKFMAVTLPGVLVLQSLIWKKPLKDKLIFLPVMLAFAYVHLTIHNTAERATNLDFLTPIKYAAQSIVFYITRSFAPINLSVLYEIKLMRFSVAEWVFTMIFLVGLYYFSRFKDLRKPIYFGVGFFVITIFPVLRIVPFEGISLVADRYFYLPSVGLLFAYASIFMFGIQNSPERGRRLLILLLVGLMSWWGRLTFERGQVWRSDETLWSDMLKTFPQSAVAHDGLGYALLVKGNIAEAKTEFRRAIELDSNYVNSHFNLGTILLGEGAAADSIEHFQAVEKIQPWNAKALLNLGVAYFKLGRREEAQAAFEKAVQQNPKLLEANLNLAAVAVQNRDWAVAFNYFGQALLLDPSSARVRSEYGRAVFEKGLEEWRADRRPEAERYFQKAMELEPALRALYQALPKKKK